MEPERSKEVERIYHAAMQREAGERSAFLEQICAGDPGLRAEVGSRLQDAESSARPLARPAVKVVARALAADLGAAHKSRRELASGQFNGQYRIVRRIGAGG